MDMSLVSRAIVGGLALAVSTSCQAAGASRQAPIVQPGAPGEPGRVLSGQAATELPRVKFTEADVTFMQGMIGHHAQALEMTALIPARTGREDVRLLGRRIELSQADEIAMMGSWLRARGQAVPGEHAHHGDGAALMPGMLTQAEMDGLTAATGAEFDRLFLEGMIKHHGGALVMVDQLHAAPGAGQESEIAAFAADVVADQQMEIDRMRAMLAVP